MIKKILDLHIHSRYSRACSANLELPKIARACEQKGIDIVATGDFTHPAWIKHIKESLVEVGNTGVYKLSSRASSQERRGIFPITDRDSSFDVGMTAESQTRFILGTEISCIYKHRDATRRVHLLILAPNIEAVEKFNKILEDRGVNIRSDGRPIMGLPVKEVLRIILEIDPRFMMIPAHAWTPWFAVFGSKSGYNTLEECFEELTPHIRAIETGLSSDPPMNHRLGALDNITLVSNSDAHSLDKLGREANVFSFASEAEITYDEICRIIKTGDRKKFLHTIEFYPEEGKYHFDGHAACQICLSPKETKAKKYLCPKCKKKVTVGVLHRVDDLADREWGPAPSRLSREMQGEFIPHKHIVPLKEIIAKVFGVGTASKKVVKEYELMIKNLGNELAILLDKNLAEIEKIVSDKNIALAIANTRAGKVKVKPGYDGVFGSVEVIFEKKQSKKQSRLL